MPPADPAQGGERDAWNELFERAATYEVTLEAVRTTLRDRRENG